MKNEEMLVECCSSFIRSDLSGSFVVDRCCFIFDVVSCSKGMVLRLVSFPWRTRAGRPYCAPLAGNSGACEARDIEAAIPLRAGQPWPQMRGPGRRMDPLTQRVKTPRAAHRTTGRGVARRLHKVSALGSWWGRSYMRQSSPPATSLPRVHCVLHKGGDLHAIHTDVRVMHDTAACRPHRRHASPRPSSAASAMRACCSQEKDQQLPTHTRHVQQD